MAFAQSSSQQDHVGLRKAVVDIVGDGDVCGDDGYIAACGKCAHELERGGAGIHDDRVAVVDECNGGLRDGLLGGNVEVDAFVLDRDGERFVKRHGPSVRAPQFTCGFEGVKIGAGGDGGDAKGLGEVRDLHGCGVLEHGENGCASFFGKGVRDAAHVNPPVRRGKCADSILLYFRIT